MKKLLSNFFVLAIICLSMTAANAQSPRLQLFEYFDNTSIPPFGALANAHFDSLADLNSSNVTFIKYHVAWGSETDTDPMNLQNQDQVATRVTYYGVTGDPDAIQDGGAGGQNTFHGQPSTLTQDYINSRIAVSSPFTIAVSYTLNATNDTIQTHTVITKTGTADGTYNTYVVVIEKLIHFDTAPGISGDTDFRNVMKRMLPSDEGMLLPSMNIGDSIVYDLNWGLENVYDNTQLAVVSFVQDNSTQEVMQAGYSDQTLQANDAAVITVSSTEGFYCDPITPGVTVHNNGSNALTSVNVNYQIDNGTTSTIPWTGNLAPGENSSVSLPELSLTGWHQVKVFTSDPNGSSDPLPINDTLKRTFSIASIAFVGVTEDFESVFPPDNWGLVNPDKSFTWMQAPVGGFGNSSKSAELSFYNIWWGHTDDLYAPTFDLSNVTGASSCDFNVAYAKYDNISHDTLQVRVSTDCGTTWQTVYSKTFTALATAPTTTGSFVPTATQWRHETIDLSSYNGQSEVLVQFHGISSYGNNLYIDDVNLSTITGISSIENDLGLYPNPTTGNVFIQLSNTINNGTAKLFSLTGENVLELKGLSGNQFSIDISKQAKGIYYLQINDGEKNLIGLRKIVLE